MTVLMSALSGCDALIPIKARTSSVSLLKADLAKRHDGRDLDVSLVSGNDGSECVFRVYDKENDFYYTVTTRSSPKRLFHKHIAGQDIDIYKNVRTISDEWLSAKMHKQAADKYTDCEFDGSDYSYNGITIPAFSVLVNINDRKDIPARLEDTVKIANEPDVKYIRLKLNYGQFAKMKPLFCVHDGEEPQTGDKVEYFFYKNMNTNGMYTEEEFLNITADELEDKYVWMQ